MMNTNRKDSIVSSISTGFVTVGTVRVYNILWLLTCEMTIQYDFYIICCLFALELAIKRCGSLNNGYF